MGPTQPPIELLPEGSFSGLKVAREEAKNSPESSAEEKK